MSRNSQLAFYNDIMGIFDSEEVEYLSLCENDFFRAYAEEYWLEQYHDLKMKSMVTHIPSITSVISDTPPSQTHEFKSKTEDSAMKSVTAQEKLDMLHECIELLPLELKELIKRKYLKRRSDGKFYEDAYIYDTLGLSRTQYYRMKKKALIELGQRLYNAHYNYHSERNGSEG